MATLKTEARTQQEKQYRDALAFIRKLLDGGAWYTSAIELDQYGRDSVDGEKARVEAIELLTSACPDSPHGGHGDPDNSGQCIYCGESFDFDG